MDLFRNKREKQEKRKQAIVKQLEGCPYSFQIPGIDMVTTNALKSLQKHLRAELDAGCWKMPVQTAASRNLLAFVLFKLRENRDAALEETATVLKQEGQQRNLVSLANKAFMLATLGKFENAQKVVDELKELRDALDVDFHYLTVKAKAEVGSSFLRFGPRFNKDAIDALKEVVPKAREPEVWVWKLMLAVAYRHALDLQHAPYVSRGQYDVTHREALALLQEVINSTPAPGDEAAAAAHRNLQANAYAETALLVRLTWDKTAEYRLCSQVQAGPMAICKRALDVDGKDPSVLWKAGKIFRNFHDLPNARVYLERSLKLQESSAAYHHLGLTFKAMATNQTHGRKRIRRGGKREQRRKKAMAFRIKNLDLSGTALATTGGVCTGVRRPEPTPAERLKKAVKCPVTVTPLDASEHLVQRAIHNLQKAVDFSAEENSRAAYDLALLHLATGDKDEALRLFTSIVDRSNSDIASPPGMLECITSQEQIALIYKAKADREVDPDKKKELYADYELTMYDALSFLSEQFSTTAVMGRVLGEVFQSPSSLLQAAAKAPDRDEADRLKTRAAIYSLMNNHSESLAVLRDIPKNAQDAEFYKVKIQACARSGRFREAATILSTCLRPTQMYNQVLSLLEQEDVEFSLYLQAGREALLEGGPCTGSYFREALRHAVQLQDQSHSYNSQGTTASVSDDDENDGNENDGDCSSARPGSQGPFDVMLFSEDDDMDMDTKAKAQVLAVILRKACRLAVVVRNNNFLVGGSELGTLLENMDNSRVVVVMPGAGHTSETFNICARAAANRGTTGTAVLLTEEVTSSSSSDVIPLELTSHRRLHCPPQLLAPGVEGLLSAGSFCQELVDAVCHLVKFLANKL